MNQLKEKAVRWLYVLAIVVILSINIIPTVIGEYAFTMHGWKSYYLDFHLTDEEGRGHSGLCGLVTIPLADVEGVFYAFEVGEGIEVEKHKRKVIEHRRDANGFHWGDGAYLWSGNIGPIPAPGGIVEGKRINREIKPWHQGELSGPGAPWDAQGNRLSFLGNFPRYAVDFEDEYFKLNLECKARASGWYLYNQGKTFTTGDFGHGNCSELPCNVTGEITHKKSNTVYKVSGWGLLEDALGTPWNWFDWGSHNWFSSNFSNGWAVGFWLAPDDWQWGYHEGPHELWVWDASRARYYTAKRVEYLDFTWEREEINGIKFPRSYRVRAVTDAGVAEITARCKSLNPIIVGVDYLPIDSSENFWLWLVATFYRTLPLKTRLNYSEAEIEGMFTYLDGTSVELEDGMGTMEFFPN
ncbi:MAG: hypothetical protein JSU92_08715, partial [Deltaproteobacteria bacterium]